MSGKGGYLVHYINILRPKEGEYHIINSEDEAIKVAKGIVESHLGDESHSCFVYKATHRIDRNMTSQAVEL